MSQSAIRSAFNNAASGDLSFDPQQFEKCISEVAKLRSQLEDARNHAANITKITGWSDADPSHVTVLQTASAKRHSDDGDAILPMLKEHIQTVESILDALRVAGLKIKRADQSNEDRMNEINGLIDAQANFKIPATPR